MPSFDEIWPQAGKEKEKDKKRKAKRMGLDYILEVRARTTFKFVGKMLILKNSSFQAMQHHGLGHLPQPDNFTTCGRLGIEVKQYNNPIECYSGGMASQRCQFIHIIEKLVKKRSRRRSPLNI